MRRPATLLLVLSLGASALPAYGRAVHGLQERHGTHVLIEVASAPFGVLNSTAAVQHAMRAAVTAGRLTVLGEKYHEFPVMGVSGLLLISESHLSIHTWPEHGYAAVDLFTCGMEAERWPSLPCSPSEAIRYGGAGAGWSCANGHAAESGSALWAAVGAMVEALQAGGASLTWLERGMPHGMGRAVAAGGQARVPGGPASSSQEDENTSFGWLGGLEGGGEL